LGGNQSTMLSISTILQRTRHVSSSSICRRKHGLPARCIMVQNLVSSLIDMI
jgi:hypothetical protein